MSIEEVINAADGMGIYVFLNKRLNKFYVGQSIYLISRVRKHINGSHNDNLNDLIDEDDTELYLVFRHDECVECGIYDKCGQVETLNILEVITYYYFVNAGYDSLNTFNRFKVEGYEELSEEEKEFLLFLVEDSLQIDLFRLGYKYKVYYEALYYKHIRQKHRLEEHVYRNIQLKDENSKVSQENYKLMTMQSLQQQIMSTVLDVPKKMQQERIKILIENTHYKQVNEELLGRYKELKESWINQADILGNLEDKYTVLEEKYLNILSESKGTEESFYKEKLRSWQIRVKGYLKQVIQLNNDNFIKQYKKFKGFNYNTKNYNDVLKDIYAEWDETMAGFEYLTKWVVLNIDNIELDENELWGIFKYGVNSRIKLTPVEILVKRIEKEEMAINILKSLCNYLKNYLKGISEINNELNTELFGVEQEGK